MKKQTAKRDFKKALSILQSFYLQYWQTDYLSVADKGDMQELLSKPYVRKMLKPKVIYSNNPEHIKAALESLGHKNLKFEPLEKYAQS
jgi:hypothetical protein